MAGRFSTARTVAVWARSLLPVLSLGGCGQDEPPAVESAGEVPSVARDPSPLDHTSESLRELLPRALLPADVESVLSLDEVTDAGDDETAKRAFENRRVDEPEWRVVRARVSLAYGWLMMSDDGGESPPTAPQLRDDIEVVRPFRKRLDEMHDRRRSGSRPR